LLGECEKLSQIAFTKLHNHVIKTESIALEWKSLTDRFEGDRLVEDRVESLAASIRVSRHLPFHQDNQRFRETLVVRRQQ
jgi:hypothetical protein